MHIVQAVTSMPHSIAFGFRNLSTATAYIVVPKEIMVLHIVQAVTSMPSLGVNLLSREGNSH